MDIAAPPPTPNRRSAASATTSNTSRPGRCGSTSGSSCAPRRRNSSPAAESESAGRARLCGRADEADERPADVAHVDEPGAHLEQDEEQQGVEIGRLALLQCHDWGGGPAGILAIERELDHDAEQGADQHI